LKPFTKKRPFSNPLNPKTNRSNNYSPENILGPIFTHRQATAYLRFRNHRKIDRVAIATTLLHTNSIQTDELRFRLLIAIPLIRNPRPTHATATSPHYLLRLIRRSAFRILYISAISNKSPDTTQQLVSKTTARSTANDLLNRHAN